MITIKMRGSYKREEKELFRDLIAFACDEFYTNEGCKGYEKKDQKCKKCRHKALCRDLINLVHYLDNTNFDN